jgi:hypothetical protein
MKTVVAAPHPPAGEGHKPGGAGANVKWLAKSVQQQDACSQHFRFDFMTSIWCGAMVGCIGAGVIPSLPESRSRRNPGCRPFEE